MLLCSYRAANPDSKNQEDANARSVTVAPSASTGERAMSAAVAPSVSRGGGSATAVATSSQADTHSAGFDITVEFNIERIIPYDEEDEEDEGDEDDEGDDTQCFFHRVYYNDARNYMTLELALLRLYLTQPQQVSLIQTEHERNELLKRIAFPPHVHRQPTKTITDEYSDVKSYIAPYKLKHDFFQEDFERYLTLLVENIGIGQNANQWTVGVHPEHLRTVYTYIVQFILPMVYLDFNKIIYIERTDREWISYSDASRTAAIFKVPLSLFFNHRNRLEEHTLYAASVNDRLNFWLFPIELIAHSAYERQQHVVDLIELDLDNYARQLYIDTFADA